MLAQKITKAMELLIKFFHVVETNTTTYYTPTHPKKNSNECNNGSDMKAKLNCKR